MSWIQKLNPKDKARRRRLLARIHILAAQRLAATGDAKAALAVIVGRISGGKTTSCGDCYFDELRAIVQSLSGETPTEPKLRKRIGGHETMSQGDYLRMLAGRVSEAYPEQAGGEFGAVLLRAKIGTDDPSEMTPAERRAGISILNTYLQRRASNAS